MRKKNNKSIINFPIVICRILIERFIQLFERRRTIFSCLNLQQVRFNQFFHNRLSLSKLRKQLYPLPSRTKTWPNSNKPKFGWLLWVSFNSHKDLSWRRAQKEQDTEDRKWHTAALLLIAKIFARWTFTPGSALCQQTWFKYGIHNHLCVVYGQVGSTML